MELALPQGNKLLVAKLDGQYWGRYPLIPFSFIEYLMYIYIIVTNS